MRLFKSVENEKNKKVLASFVLLLVLVLSVVGVFIVRTMGNEEDLLANLHFNDVKVVEENGLYTYTSTLTVDEKDNVDTIKINFYQADTKITTLYGYVGREVIPEDKINLEASTNINIKDYDKITYER